MTEQGQVVAVRQYAIAQFREAGTGVVTIASGGVGVGGAGGGGAVDSVNSQTGTVVLDAADIAITDAANDFTATDVEGALAELQADAEADATALSDHVADTTAAHAASAISFTPNGSIAATDVQAAIQEVRDEAAGATDLAWDAATSKVTSNTGTDATLTAVDGSNPGLMTVAQKSKLDGIESGATADMTAAEILAALLTVDGSGSGLDADTLDGTSSAGFATASHNHSGVYDPAGTAASAVAAHEADTTSVHGITDTSALYRSGGTDVAVADGGTGASDAATARTNLGAQQGPLTGDVTTSGAAATLAASGVTAGTYGSSSKTITETVDAKGRVTAVTENDINFQQYAWGFSFAHSYGQMGGNNLQSVAYADALNIAFASTDRTDNFLNRFWSTLSIPTTNVRQLGKSGAIAGGSELGDATNAYGAFYPQGIGVVFRHFLPPHYRATSGNTPNSNAKASGGVVAFMLGYNDALGDINGIPTRAVTAYKAGLAAATSRVLARAVYDDGHSSIVFGGSGGSHWSTQTQSCATGGSMRVSTTDNDTVTITIPADLKVTGTEYLAVVCGANSYSRTALSSGINNSTTTIPVYERAYFPQSGNFTILIDSEELLVTAGHGTGAGNFTATRAQNSTSAASHSSSAYVTTPASSAIATLSGTAANATGTIDLAGMGARGQNGLGVLTIKRIPITSTDAGKTIILTFSAKKTGESYFFDSWHIEDPDGPVVLHVNQPNGPTGNAFVNPSIATINTAIGTMISDYSFGSNVAVVDAATDFAALFNFTVQTAISSTSSTTIHITPSTAASNLIAKGSVIRIDSEEMLVTGDLTKTSNSDWSVPVSRGYNSTTAATHSLAAQGMDCRWVGADRIHPSSIGHELLCKSMLAKLKTLTQTTGQVANSGGLPLAVYPRLRDGGYIAANQSSSTLAGPTLGVAYMTPFWVGEDIIVTAASVALSSAGAAGTATCRIGIYADGQGLPGALIADLGTVATDATTERIITCDVPLSRGWYWRLAVPQGSGSTGTYRTWNATGNIPEPAYPLQRWTNGAPVSPFSGGSAASNVVGYSYSGITGALPVSLYRTAPGGSHPLSDVSNVIAVALKISVPIQD